MRQVVAPDADDLPRQDGRQQADVAQRAIGFQAAEFGIGGAFDRPDAIFKQPAQARRWVIAALVADEPHGVLQECS